MLWLAPGHLLVFLPHLRAKTFDYQNNHDHHDDHHDHDDHKADDIDDDDDDSDDSLGAFDKWGERLLMTR